MMKYVLILWLGTNLDSMTYFDTKEDCNIAAALIQTLPLTAKDIRTDCNTMAEDEG